ncbi:hypothetical protein D3C78_1894350 [compost metagenome]
MKVKARKIVYYTDPVLKVRAGLPTPPVPAADEALLKTLTVPIRLGSKPIAIQAPHNAVITEEMERRNN